MLFHFVTPKWLTVPEVLTNKLINTNTTTPRKFVTKKIKEGILPFLIKFLINLLTICKQFTDTSCFFPEMITFCCWAGFKIGGVASYPPQYAPGIHICLVHSWHFQTDFHLKQLHHPNLQVTRIVSNYFNCLICIYQYSA